MIIDKKPSSSKGASGVSAAFFDVDRTLMRGSALLALAPSMYKDGLISRRTVVRALRRQLLFRRHGIDDAGLEAAASEIAALVKGMNAGALQQLAGQRVRSHLLPRVFPQARQLMDWHREAGHRIYLVSAAPQELILPLAAALGADGAAATRAEIRDGLYTGRVLFFCHAGNKKKAIEAIAARDGIDLGASQAYGDSHSDLAMLEAVGRPICINPDKRLLAEAGKRGWMALQFTSPGTHTIIRNLASVRKLGARSPRQRQTVGGSPIDLSGGNAAGGSPRMAGDTEGLSGL